MRATQLNAQPVDEEGSSEEEDQEYDSEGDSQESDEAHEIADPRKNKRNDELKERPSGRDSHQNIQKKRSMISKDEVKQNEASFGESDEEDDSDEYEEADEEDHKNSRLSHNKRQNLQQ